MSESAILGMDVSYVEKVYSDGIRISNNVHSRSPTTLTYYNHPPLAARVMQE